jgi:hypothetical protein
MVATPRLVQKKLVELGRIRIGDRVPTQSGKGTRPHKLLQFRLTSPNPALLNFAASSYGGDVRPWVGDGAPVDEHGRPTQRELYTNVNALDVLIPTMSAVNLSYELWSAAGCQRRCTGDVITHCPLHEAQIGSPCCCPEDDHERQALATQGKACARILRLNVLLPDLPGMGTWRLETKGYYATAELLGTLDMLTMAGQTHHIIEAVLRLEQRTVKRPGNGQGTGTLTFAVPILWPKWSPRQILASAASQGHILMATPSTPEALKTLPEHIADLYGDDASALPPGTPETDLPEPDSASVAARQLREEIEAQLTTMGYSAQKRTQWRGRVCRRYNVQRFEQLTLENLSALLTMIETHTTAPTEEPTPAEPRPEPEPEPEPAPEPEPSPEEDDTPPAPDVDPATVETRSMILDLAPHVQDRWKAEEATALAEDPAATLDQLQAALLTLQNVAADEHRQGALDGPDPA